MGCRSHWRTPPTTTPTANNTRPTRCSTRVNCELRSPPSLRPLPSLSRHLCVHLVSIVRLSVTLLCSCMVAVLLRFVAFGRYPYCLLLSTCLDTTTSY